MTPTPENALDLFRMGMDTYDIACLMGLKRTCLRAGWGERPDEAAVMQLLEEARFGTKGFVAPPVREPSTHLYGWARKR